jgi:SAM-dependent methyltransferase
VYTKHLAPHAGKIIGLEYEFDRLREARRASAFLVSAAGENLPFPRAAFDVILSHEVLEHVRDDRAAVSEMVRTLKPGGRMVVFVPNRGYPFETHGIYWRGRYHFGNIPLVGYLPRAWRNRLAPHVRTYTAGDLERLFAPYPLKVIHRQVIFGAYDNVIARWSVLGRALRAILQALEHTPFQVFGLSHFWVVERV